MFQHFDFFYEFVDAFHLLLIHACIMSAFLLRVNIKHAFEGNAKIETWLVVVSTFKETFAPFSFNHNLLYR